MTSPKSAEQDAMSQLSLDIQELVRPMFEEVQQAQVKRLEESIGKLDFLTGITAVKEFIDAVNLYVTEQEPWKVAKDPDQVERLHTILYVMCECLRAVAVLYNPAPSPDLDMSLLHEEALILIASRQAQGKSKSGALPPTVTPSAK